jgi:hypothetical protein
MSKLIVNEIEKYDAGQLTITTGTNVSIGSDLTVGGALAGTLSTAAQTNVTSVGTLSSLAVSGNLTVDTDNLIVDSSSGNVLINGTTSTNSTAKLQVFGSTQVSTNNGQIRVNDSVTPTKTLSIGVDGTNDVAFLQSFQDGVAYRDLILQGIGGNVGIGTSSPNARLRVENSTALTTVLNAVGLNGYIAIDNVASGQNYYNANDFHLFQNNGVSKVRIDADGLKFGADTAAANALDDYEEGTWTMGVAFGGASAGVIYNINTGTYTKVGRQVTVNGWLVLIDKGSSVGNATITGLPFAAGSGNQNYAAASLRIDNVTFANIIQGYANIGGTDVPLEEITEAGVLTSITNGNFVNNSSIMINFTYFTA